MVIPISQCGIIGVDGHRKGSVAQSIQLGYAGWKANLAQQCLTGKSPQILHSHKLLYKVELYNWYEQARINYCSCWLPMLWITFIFLSEMDRALYYKLLSKFLRYLVWLELEVNVYSVYKKHLGQLLKRKSAKLCDFLRNTKRLASVFMGIISYSNHEYLKSNGLIAYFHQIDEFSLEWSSSDQ